MTLLCATLLPFLAGWLSINLLWPRDSQQGTGLLRFFLAWGAGTGLTSIAFYLQLLVFDSPRAAPFAVELGLIAVLVAVHVLRHKMGSSEGSPLPQAAANHPSAATRWDWLLGVVLCFLLIHALATFLLQSLEAPHGLGDAVWIWNVRARFLFHLDEAWLSSFDPKTHGLHADYPLLLPGLITRTWAALGQASPVVPAVIGFVFTFASAGLLYSSLAYLRGRSAGLLAAIALLGTTAFVRCGASQLADVPAAFFFLGSLVLLACKDHDSQRRQSWVILAGFCAGLAAWTKNEGALFLLVLPIACLPRIRAHGWRAYGREMLILALGMSPLVLVILSFKSLVPQPNEIVEVMGSAALWEHVQDPGRYLAVARSLLRYLWEPAPGMILALIALPLLLGLNRNANRRYSAITPLLATGLMLLGYCAVYVLTSMDLQWHLRTSMSRLVLQLWPGLILSAFLLASLSRDRAAKTTVAHGPAASSLTTSP